MTMIAARLDCRPFQRMALAAVHYHEVGIGNHLAISVGEARIDEIVIAVGQSGSNLNPAFTAHGIDIDGRLGIAMTGVATAGVAALRGNDMLQVTVAAARDQLITDKYAVISTTGQPRENIMTFTAVSLGIMVGVAAVIFPESGAVMADLA